MFSLGSAPLVRAFWWKRSFVARACFGAASALEKTVRACFGAASALKKAVRACLVPPVRSKRLFVPASVPPVRSKRLFVSGVQDHYSKVLDSARLCSVPLCSALLGPCMDMHGSTLVYNMICIVLTHELASECGRRAADAILVGKCTEIRPRSNGVPARKSLPYR